MSGQNRPVNHVSLVYAASHSSRESDYPSVPDAAMDPTGPVGAGMVEVECGVSDLGRRTPSDGFVNQGVRMPSESTATGVMYLDEASMSRRGLCRFLFSNTLLYNLS